jgi:hypothetical protein
MSLHHDEPREVEIVFGEDSKRVRGEVFKDALGDWFAKLSGSQLADRDELKNVLTEGEEPVTVWVRVTDGLSRRFITEGQALSAWVRVKRSDGKFVTKTALFSLGAIAAITITRAIRQHRPRQ